MNRIYRVKIIIIMNRLSRINIMNRLQILNKVNRLNKLNVLNRLKTELTEYTETRLKILIY